MPNDTLTLNHRDNSVKEGYDKVGGKYSYEVSGRFVIKTCIFVLLFGSIVTLLVCLVSPRCTVTEALQFTGIVFAVSVVLLVGVNVFMISAGWIHRE